VIGLREPTVFSHEDFEDFTQGFRLCDEHEEMGPEEFAPPLPPLPY
jgi:hypothetical protein